MKFRRSQDSFLPLDADICSVTKMNDIIELCVIQHIPTGLDKIQKLDKDRYVVKETGEIKEYAKSENRGDNIAGLKKSFKKMRNLINNNFTGAKNELFLTLTYRENITDTARLYRDFEIFMKRLRRRYPDVDYFSSVEPQGRGAWHSHVLLRFNGRKSIFIPNDEIAALWGHGFTTTRSLSKVDNIGAYLTAYLTDLEAPEDMEETSRNIVTKDVPDPDTGKTVKKKFIKGGRLHMYPVGMQIFRHSRGIKKPESLRLPFDDAKEIVGSHTPDYSTTIEILDDDGRILNTVSYYHFNLRRTKKQGDALNDSSHSSRRIPDKPSDTGKLSKHHQILP